MTSSLIIASDHGGFKLKNEICTHFKSIQINDLGTYNEESVDYPDYAYKLAVHLKKNPNEFGMLICGSGIGISIAANRHTHIRAALCRDVNDAKFARSHNNANVLVLGGRITDAELAFKIIDTFISTSFEGGRHQIRIDKLEGNDEKL